ncbi:MAG TPA: PKD domain-containing protein [Bacteroidia bacterium]|nr:PKD domain-containing protein [Bacteroidia bacterium]HRS59987.1 PKD domain-containing protein [Bacteroidia bacterium]HRU68801.1 PKD domain-containing protein [Bacteroidia bacterium]
MKKHFYVFILIIPLIFLFSARAQQLPTINVTYKNNPSDGYIFLANYGSATAGVNYLLILDKQGRIIFAKSFPYTMNGSLLDFKVLPNNKYSFFNSKMNQHYILDKNFNIINTVKAKNGYSPNNHELVMSEDNKYFIIADETRSIDMSKIVSGGNTNAQVTGNVIQGIDSNDNLIFEWKILDHIPITDHAGDLTAPSFDFAHTNSLFLDTDSSILLCNPALNEITKVSLKDGRIIWRFGLNSNGNQFTFVNDTLGFIFQHSVNRLHNGNLTLFDNGLGRYARAVEYEIDENLKTAKLVFQYRHNPDVTGPSMGSVIRLPNGNTFIGWGSANKMTEVDTNGNCVFEATFPNTTYRALKYDIPNPIAHLISGTTEVCRGEIATYTATPFANSAYSWNITNGTIVSGQGTNEVTVRWTTNGTGVVKLTKANSQNQKDIFLIYVNILPVPDLKMIVEKNCKEVRFIDSTQNVINRLWSFGDGDTSVLPEINHFYGASGSFNVSLKVMNNYGCYDSNIVNLIVPDTPKADFYIDSVVCVNQYVTVTNNTFDADNFYWNFGNSATSDVKNPLPFFFDSAGIYHVKLIASNSGCMDSIIQTVTVYSNPKAYFVFDKICQGVRFTDSSLNHLNQVWDLGDGQFSSSGRFEHLYQLPGSYQVKLKVFNSMGCVDSSIRTIYIPAPPKADFSLDSVVCEGQNVHISNQSTNADTFYWDLGNSVNSNLKDPLPYFYDKSGTFEVRLVASGSDCFDTMKKSVQVYPNPKAEFGFSEICHGALFYDSSLNHNDLVWDFGDGSTSTSAIVRHFYNGPGNYEVKLKVVDHHGCADSVVHSVMIPPAPKAYFSTDPVVCVNEEITIQNNSVFAGYFLWDFGDTRTSFLSTPEPFSYSKPGSYKIKLVASDSFCSDSFFQTIDVAPDPEVIFNSFQLSDSSIQFIDFSTISSGSVIYWVWNFGDGSTSAERNPVHSFSSPGVYWVELCVSSDAGCVSCEKKSFVLKSNGTEQPETENRITIFPNPNHGHFTVSSSKTPDFILIINMLGEEVLKVKPQTETEIIDLSGQSNGFYLLKLIIDGREQTFRLIKM